MSDRQKFNFFAKKYPIVVSRIESRAVATSKMELFVIIGDGF